MCELSIASGRAKIRQWMKYNDYSYGDLAKVYGYSKQTIYQYITGKSKTPAATKFIMAIIKQNHIK